MKYCASQLVPVGRGLAGMAVIIPAHDEQERLGRCLDSVRAAMDHLAGACPQVEAMAIVVADSCSDGTAQIARRHISEDPRISLQQVGYGNVGASRAAGARYALAGLGARMDPASIWLASTDADTSVPENWLAGFAELHARGADAVVGTVQPDRGELDEHLFNLWQQAYHPVEGHGHIHGANFGVSAAAYLGVGGFEPLAAHEDVALVTCLRRAGYRVQATARMQVLTSGRLHGRLREGFADYLAGLDHQMLRAR